MDLIQLGGPSRLPRPTSRRPWTSEEDSALIEAVRVYGSETGQGSSWAKISSAVGGGRTNKDCRKRWFYTLDPSLRKGRWTREEDATLRLAYGELGPQWREIASRIPGRNDEQIAKRWKDVLSPDLSLDTPWTPEEDLLLLQLFKEMGPKWTPMSDNFPGRNGIACRNRFRKFKSLRPGVVSTTPDPSGQIQQQTLDYIGGQSAAIEFDSAKQSEIQENTGTNQSDFPPIDPLDPHPQPVSTSRRQSLILQQWLDATFGTEDNNFHQWPTIDMDVDLDLDLELELPEIQTTTESESIQSQSQSQQREREQEQDQDQGPIANAWGLLVALDAGQETLTLTSGLVRQLLADASRS